MNNKLLITVAFLLVGCGADNNNESTTPDAASVAEEIASGATHSLVALPGMEDAVPEVTQITTVLMRTEAGDLSIDIYPEAAPNAAARFIELVEAGFYNNTPVFRVVPGFVAQFGINWRGDYPGWQENTFDDDPSLFALDRGTLAFAKAGPNTNSTQVFINYVENNRLAAPQFNFTVFGKVVSGMEVVDAFVAVGDPNMGLDQGQLWADGGTYLDSLDEKPVMIESATVLASP